jgi:transposase
LSELGALRVLDPEKWARKVRGAMRKSSGRVPDAAIELGVSVRQLYRWLGAKGEDGVALFENVERAGPGPRPDDED